MTYEKDMTIEEKFEHYFHQELHCNGDDLQEVIDLFVFLMRSHKMMDEETFKAKMNRFFEFACGGYLKKAMVDGLNEYLGIEK